MKECNELRNKLADVGYSHAAERKILFERIEELMACNQNNDSNSDSEVSYDEATHVNLKTTRKDSSLKNIEHDVTYLRKLIELQEEDLKAKDKLLAENEKNLQQAQSTLADQEMNNSKLSQAAAVLQNENFQDYQEKLQTIDDLEYKLEETTRELRDTKEKIEKLDSR
ncbi:hypothetical protein BDF14DRAFT_1014643 [Spinellus fusiger]|nr:hypothetical protein BDF14DRAFT_1014643 [Spinellus fusiger]